MGNDNKKIFEAYSLADTRNKFAAERGQKAGGQILQDLKNQVKELAGPHATIKQAKEAFFKVLQMPHARHFSHTLHNDLMMTRGPQNRKRKYMDALYSPPEGKFDWEYMKRWLQTEILMPYVGGGKWAGKTLYL